jgi:acyl-CoA dehydrogenase
VTLSAEEQRLLEQSLEQLARDATAACGNRRPPFLERGWAALADHGIDRLLLPTGLGGSGCGWRDACSVLRCVGRFALPLPLAEHLLATRLLAGGAPQAGDRTPPEGHRAMAQAGAGPFTVATRVEGAVHQAGEGWSFSGTASAVPWGRHASQLVAQPAGPAGPLVMLSPAAAEVRPGDNLAGEPRDTLLFSHAPAILLAQSSRDGTDLRTTCALLRACQAVGAMEAALGLSIDHATTRVQFGRPIGRQQAVQQQLSLFGEELAAANCAVHAACRALDRGAAPFQTAAAILRVNLAIEVATGTAHQVHAAIGFTRDHPLHLWTQRLWAWRSEFGADSEWAQHLGELALASGADGFWHDLTGRDDACG